MVQTECLKLTRDHGEPWGFRLQGGKDFSCPLTIVRVNKGSRAEKSGLKVGHCVLSVNGVDTLGFTHKDALDAIVEAEDNLEFIVKFLELGPLWKGNKSRPVSQIFTCDPVTPERKATPQPLGGETPIEIKAPMTGAVPLLPMETNSLSTKLETVPASVVDLLPVESAMELPIPVDMEQTSQYQPGQREQPEEPSQTQPEQFDQAQLEQPDQIQPDQSVQIQPEQPDQIQPEQYVQTQPEQPDQIQPEQYVQTQPEQPYQIQPEQSVQIQPEQPDRIQLEQTVQSDSEQLLNTSVPSNLAIPPEIIRAPSPLFAPLGSPHAPTQGIFEAPHKQEKIRMISESQIFGDGREMTVDEALFESIYKANASEQLPAAHHNTATSALPEGSKDHALELLKKKLPHEQHSTQSEIFLHPVESLPVSRGEAPVERVQSPPLDLENFPPPSLDFKIINMATGDEVCGNQIVHVPEHDETVLSPPIKLVHEELSHHKQPSLVEAPCEEVVAQKSFCSVLGYDKPQPVHPYQPINTTVNPQYIPGFAIPKENKITEKPIRYSLLEEKYTEDEIAETLTSQAEILNTGVIGVDFQKNAARKPVNKDSEVYKMVHNLVKDPMKGICALPGKIDDEKKSVLNKAIGSTEKGMREHKMEYLIKRLIQSYLNNGKKYRSELASN